MRVAQSSHIQGHDYDAESKTMHIMFTNGAVYRFDGVPETEYYNLSQSASPGSYFHSKIKGQYKSSLIAAGPSQRRKK